MSKKTLADEIFGVSECKGMCTGGDKRGAVPASAEGGTPHWHDSAFKGTEVKEGPVTEKELSSHF